MTLAEKIAQALSNKEQAISQANYWQGIHDGLMQSQDVDPEPEPEPKKKDK